jgi:hypothetical protein
MGIEDADGCAETVPNHICYFSTKLHTLVLVACMWGITKPHCISFGGMPVRHHQTALYQFWWHVYETSPHHIYQFWWFTYVYKGCWQLVNKFILIMQFCVVIIVTYRLMYFICIFTVRVYVFLLLSVYSYCLSMYSYCCLCIIVRPCIHIVVCILIVVYVFLDAATLTEVFPCLFLGCKANARV